MKEYKLICKISIRKDKELKRKYNLTLEQKQEMIKSQEGRCLICNQISSELHVDHNHKSGKVRGLLCKNCNARVLPIVEHLSHLIPKAIDYLKQSEGALS